MNTKPVMPSNDPSYYIDYLKKEVNPGYMAPKVEIPVPSSEERTGVSGKEFHFMTYEEGDE